MGFALRFPPAALALLLADGAYARTHVLKTEAGSVVHWTRGEITVGLDPAAASRGLQHFEVLLALERAAATWNRIPADQPRFRLTADGRHDVTIGFCRGRWQGDAIDLGRTEFVASPRDGHVSAATVELNECDHQFTPPGEAAEHRLDLQSVMVHELGHVLGLGHADDPSAVMFAKGTGAGVRIPSAADEASLAIIYLGRAPPPAPGLSVAATTAGRLGMAPTPATTPDGSGSPLTGRPPIENAPAADRGRGPASPPEDSVSVLSVRAGSGRELVVYTCEPTLLPAISESPPEKGGRRVKPPGPRKAR